MQLSEMQRTWKVNTEVHPNESTGYLQELQDVCIETCLS